MKQSDRIHPQKMQKKGYSQSDRGTCADVLKESRSIESSKEHSQSFENVYPNLPHSDEESNPRLSAENCSSSENEDEDVTDYIPEANPEKKPLHKKAEKTVCKYRGCNGMKWPVILTSIIVMLIAIICNGDFGKFNEFSPKHSYRSIKNFEEKTGDIRLQFSNQYNETMKFIVNNGKEHLEKVFAEDKTSLRPLSFLVAAYRGATDTQSCFIQKISDAFTTNTYDIIHCKYYNESNGRKKLDHKIKESLKDIQKFVVIKDIHLLHFDAAQLFMSYADSYNDIASFPQSLLLLTTVLPFEYNETNKRIKDEGKVGDYFRDVIWKGQNSTNNIAALWSRIGDGLVLLKAEETDFCN